MSDNDGDDKTEPMFTRAQMAKMVNAQVREKVAAALAEIGDIEELKRKAAEADRQKSSIDKMSEQLDALTKRAELAEVENARQRVASKLGLTPKQAKRLSGKTYDELLADGEEMVEDLGIKPQSPSRNDQRQSDNSNTGDDTDNRDDEQHDEDDEPAPRPQPRRIRPRELRSGAPMSDERQEETDPLKLVAGVPRR